MRVWPLGPARVTRGTEGSARRLGWYIDAVYRRPPHPATATQLSTLGESFPFLLFACEVGRHFSQLSFFGRVTGDIGAEWFELPAMAECVELPYYESLRDLGAVWSAGGGTVRAMWRGLGRVDTIAVFGPHPFGLLLIVFALVRRRKVVIGIRQDTMNYFKSRVPSRRARALLPLLRILDRCFRGLARVLPTVVVGAHVEASFGGPRAGLLQLRPSLVRSIDVVEPRSQPTLGDGEVVELLTVGRLEPEKNPILLVEALARLEAQAPGRFRLTWVGIGRLREAVLRRAAELGVAHLISLPGFVPFGPDLLARYRRAHLFVHVALTEAFGQVLVEAMASGTPIIATAVGGVPDVLEHGRAGRLVPPSNAPALADAIVALADDRGARDGLARRGIEIARASTLEFEAARFARFALADVVRSPARVRDDDFRV